MEPIGETELKTLTLEGNADIQALTVACTEMDPTQVDRETFRRVTTLGRIAWAVETSAPTQRLVLHAPFAKIGLKALRILSVSDLGVRGEHPAYLEIQEHARRLVETADSKVRAES